MPLDAEIVEIELNPYLQGNYAPVPSETTSLDLEVEGDIPEELNGRFVRIGPNPVGDVDPKTYHWFTGAGMVHGLRLRGGKAEWYRNRHVVSGRVAEALGRPDLDGPHNGFGDNTANTNILSFDGKTYAVVEAGGLPIELTDELESVARSSFGATLPHGFAAHPKQDPVTGEWHTITYQPGLEALSYLVVDKAGKARKVADVPAPHGPMVHDTAFTEKFVVVLDLPAVFNLANLQYGFPYGWDHERTPRVGLLPRDGDVSKMAWFETPSCYVFHIMNAFDLGDETVIDVVRHPRVFDTERRGPNEGEPYLARWRLNRITGKLSESVLDPQSCEFPRFNDAFGGKPYRYGYSAAAFHGGFGASLKHDLDRGVTTAHDYGAGRAGLEPVFVARENARAEDDGFILNYVYDANRNASDVVIFDAQDFAGPAIATVKLPARVPFGFHGNWLADAG